MVEEDFREMAAAVVTLLGEVGLGGVKAGDGARRMVGWACKHGIQSTEQLGYYWVLVLGVLLVVSVILLPRGLLGWLLELPLPARLAGRGRPASAAPAHRS